MIPIRDENPTPRPPAVTYVLLAGCMLVFLWQLSLSERELKMAVFALGMIPATLFAGAHLPPEVQLVPPAWTLLTSMFLHGGWLHLAGNLLFLWVFGDNVEAAMGHLRFLLFYLLCGIAAAFAQAFPDPSATTPMIGASGAISGVLGAYLMLFPRARVLVFVPVVFAPPLVHLAAVWVLGFWFLIQLLSSIFAGTQEGGVAFMAHVGGFLAGMVLVVLFKRRGVPLFRRD